MTNSQKSDILFYTAMGCATAAAFIAKGIVCALVVVSVCAGMLSLVYGISEIK